MAKRIDISEWEPPVKSVDISEWEPPVKSVDISEWEPPPKIPSLGEQLLSGQTPQDPSPPMSFPRENFTPERFPEITPPPLQAEQVPELGLPVPVPREEWQGLNLPLASPEEVAKNEGLLKKIREVRAKKALISSFKNITKQMKDLSLPGGRRVDDYGRAKIQEVKDRYTPPLLPDEGLTPQKVDELSERQQEILDRLNLDITQAQPVTDKPPVMDWQQQLLYHTAPSVLNEPQRQEYANLHEQYGSKIEKGGQKGFETAMDAMDWIFNLPVRPMAELVDMAREGATYTGQGMEGQAPDLSLGRLWKAAMRDQGASRSFTDTFTKSYQQAQGGRDVTVGENLLIAGLGTVADVMTGGWGWGKVAPFRSKTLTPKEAKGKFYWSGKEIHKPMTAQRAVEENLRAVLDKSTLQAPVATRDLEHVALNTVRSPATPDQIRTVRKMMRSLAREHGATSKQLREIDRLLIKRIGDQGMNLTRAGKWPTLQRAFDPLTDAQVKRIQNPRKTDLPFGAGQREGVVSGIGQSLRSVFSADRGMPQSALRLTRKNDSQALAGIAQVQKDAKTLDRLYAPTKEPMSGFRGQELMKFQSRASLKERADRGIVKYRDLAGKFRKALDDTDVAVEKALRNGDINEANRLLAKLEQEIRTYKNATPQTRSSMRGKMYWSKRNMNQAGGGQAGQQAIAKGLDKIRQSEEKALAWVEDKYQQVVDMMEDAIRRGWGPQNENDRQVLKYLEETFEERWSRERAIGVNGRIGKYIPQIETEESVASQIPEMGAKAAAGSRRMGFRKPRLDWTHLTTVEGTRLRAFHQEPGKLLAARVSGGLLAEAAAKNEADLLKSFGTRLEALGKRNPKGVKAAQGLDVKNAYAKNKNQQVAIYTQKYGAGKGSRYIIDKNIADVLDRSMNPEGISKFWNAWFEANNWWKSMATVGRPQFLWRNLILGNFINMWLGGVDLSLFNDAMKIMSVKNGTGLRARLTGNEIPRSLFSHDVTLDTRIRGKTVREWIKEGEDANVFSPGKYELETQTANPHSVSANPLSRNNPLNYMVGKANNAVEQGSKLATLMDSMIKGGQNWEGAERTAELLFNMNETGKLLGSTALKIAGGFYKWAYKNMGLQFTSMLSRPGRLSQYYSWRSGIENLDITNQREFDLGATITPEDRRSLQLQKQALSRGSKKKGLFWEPIVRGPEGGRMVFQGAAAIPMDALEQFGWENMLNGKFSDFALSAMGGLTDYLGAATGLIYKSIALKQTGKMPTFQGSSISSPADQFNPAPPYLETAIEWIRRNDKWLYDRLKNDANWITPEVEWIGGKPVVTGRHKVSRNFLMTVETVDPQFSVLRRIASDLGSVMFLGKSQELNKPTMVNEQRKAASEAMEKLNQERTRQEQSGMRPVFK